MAMVAHELENEPPPSKLAGIVGPRPLVYAKDVGFYDKHTGSRHEASTYRTAAKG